MAAELPDHDDQDQAEVFDEDNLLPDSDRMKGGDDGLTGDTMPDVFDSTYARGDNDTDDDDEALDEDEESDELLESLGDEGDDEDDLDVDDPVDALDADNLTNETLAVDFEDNDLVDGVDRLQPDEVELIDVEDADTLGGATGLSVADLESDNLSDEDLMELDYKDPATGGTRGGGTGDVRRGDGPAGVGPAGVGPAGNSGQEADRAAGSLDKPSGQDSDAPEREDERLDEGVEETFPASDPISVKHIT